jgi:hypothetical protein
MYSSWICSPTLSFPRSEDLECCIIFFISFYLQEFVVWIGILVHLDWLGLVDKESLGQMRIR